MYFLITFNKICNDPFWFDINYILLHSFNCSHNILSLVGAITDASFDVLLRDNTILGQHLTILTHVYICSHESTQLHKFI